MAPRIGEPQISNGSGTAVLPPHILPSLKRLRRTRPLHSDWRVTFGGWDEPLDPVDERL